MKYIALLLGCLGICGCASESEVSPSAAIPTPTISPAISPSAQLVPSPSVAPFPVVAAPPVALPQISAAPESAPSSIGHNPTGDNVPQIVAEISADIRSARSANFANDHASAADKMAQILTDKIRSNPSKAGIYAQWSSAMHHLSAAAKFKAASFNAWNDLDARSKVLNMEAELQAAKGEAVTTQQLIAGSHP